MIPVLLKLSNFTSYGEKAPELNFTKFKLAAISGPNGAGKSSLLDAITWCLWGTSRAGDSSDELVRLGSDKMFVQFSFELDGNLYTVKRARSKKSGGNTSLEVWSGTEKKPETHNLTEGTIKASQQKIIDTLHLSFETFTNSSFLRQGHADEFTTKGPTDRKRILADILGLDHYDKLEEKAKEKIKEAEIKLTLLDYQLLEIEAELSLKKDREKNFSQIQNEVNSAKKGVLEIESLIKTIEEEKQSIQVKVSTLLESKKRFEDLNKEIEDLKLQIKLKENTKEEYQLILDQKQVIEKNYQMLQKLQEKKKTLDNKRSHLIKLKDELVLIEKQINEREDKRKQTIAHLEIEGKEFETKNEQLKLQNEKLSKEKTLCPTCNQPISGEKNREIILNNKKQIEENNEKLKDLRQKIEKYKVVILPEYQLAKGKDMEVKKLEEETKEYFETTKTLLELDKYSQAYMKLQQAEVAVKTHQETLIDLEKIYKIKSKDLEKSQNFKENLDKFSKTLEEIEEKLEGKMEVKKELSQKVLDLSGRAGEAKQLIDRTIQIENLFNLKKKEKNKLTKEKEIFEELSLAFGKRGIQAMIIEAAIPEIEDEANRLLNKLTEGRMKVRFETQKETKTKVQTSEGKVHALVETLDIIISDEMGERNYDLYSGGETFRVNFAIRLAISKLLTHRAGAKLQFLIIDEGFGTQDATGRARLIEVIDAIKDDFEKILIITHLEELKDEFPVRIEVSKDASGSTFEMVGA